MCSKSVALEATMAISILRSELAFLASASEISSGPVSLLRFLADLAVWVPEPLATGGGELLNLALVVVLGVQGDPV
jgi:hypothetical protein